MISGRFILCQILDLIHRETLSRLATRFHADSRVRHFGVRQQLICMVFAQMTWRDGLRDIVECLNAKPEALYHLGFREPVAKSTLADANEGRDWRLWEALALSLIPKARSLYAGEDLGLDLENTIYALVMGRNALGATVAKPAVKVVGAVDSPSVDTVEYRDQLYAAVEYVVTSPVVATIRGSATVTGNKKVSVAATLYALVGQKRSCLGKNLSFEMQGIAYCKQRRCIFNFSHEAIQCKHRNFNGNNCTIYAGLHKDDDHCGRRHAAKWV
jgi:hypothetical protein